MRPLHSILAVAVSGIVGLGAIAPSTAQAGDFSVGITIVSGRPMRTVWVEPVYETRVERVWVEPQYQTVTEQVWRPAVVESRVTGRTWVPDRYEQREIRTVDQYGRVMIRRETVLAEPAHWQETRTDVVVAPGYYETVTRQVAIREGGWQTVQNRVCVREGHWAQVPAYAEPIYVAPAPVIVERPVYYRNYGDRNTRGGDANHYREKYDDKYRGERDGRDRDRNQQRDSQDRGDRYR